MDYRLALVWFATDVPRTHPSAKKFVCQEFHVIRHYDMHIPNLESDAFFLECAHHFHGRYFYVQEHKGNAIRLTNVGPVILGTRRP